MKFIESYNDKLGCQNDDEVFHYLLNNLKPTIKDWNYFVNWEKVLRSYNIFEDELNILNGLIGKKDIEQEACRIFTKYPQVISTIPILLACREKKLSLLSDYKSGFIDKDFIFNEKLSISDAVLFMKNSGLLKIFQDKTVKSIPDYVIGVEVGLDSNGRKNRGGTAMEAIIDFFITDMCKRNRWEWITQATQKKIKEKWNKHITLEKSDRAIDFAVMVNNTLFLIEANFYGGSGSKLKSTAGEYKSDFLRHKSDGHNFIWITDGAGWKVTHKPLRETFDDIDYILNLTMIEKGILEDIFVK